MAETTYVLTTPARQRKRAYLLEPEAISYEVEYQQASSSTFQAKEVLTFNRVVCVVSML
jgi:hypothetical protein